MYKYIIAPPTLKICLNTCTNTCTNTCFPVSTPGVLTPVLVSQHLSLKGDLCLNVNPQPLRAASRAGHRVHSEGCNYRDIRVRNSRHVAARRRVSTHTRTTRDPDHRPGHAQWADGELTNFGRGSPDAMRAAPFLRRGPVPGAHACDLELVCRFKTQVLHRDHSHAQRCPMAAACSTLSSRPPRRARHPQRGVLTRSPAGEEGMDPDTRGGCFARCSGRLYSLQQSLPGTKRRRHSAAGAWAQARVERGG